MKRTLKLSRLILIAAVCGLLSSCEDPQVYGSMSVSSYSGGGYYGYGGRYGNRYGGPRYGGTIGVGGRIM